ncbi:MAG: hypothetical protein EOP61_07250 [Sphingomonadales bacterium]|nr:MAG: hypothetical protein EOP61_07250 [Sphingomonadales bacterium]
MSFKKLIAAAAFAVAGMAASVPAANAAPVATHSGASTLTVSLAASAQRWGHRDERRYDRGHRRGWDRGRYNRRHYGRRVCRTEWRHHRRVQVCYRR